MPFEVDKTDHPAPPPLPLPLPFEVEKTPWLRGLGKISSIANSTLNELAPSGSFSSGSKAIVIGFLANATVAFQVGSVIITGAAWYILPRSLYVDDDHSKRI